jgi:hypothetical protein
MDLSRSTQHLIDSRLDTIDRMLLGRVSRQERLEIVREVEGQIFEQLHARGADESSREDVLAVLARLDPPEAYLPEEAGDYGPVPSRRSLGPRVGRTEPARGGPLRIAKASGILGLVVMGLIMLGIPLAYGIAVTFQSEAALIVLGGGILAMSFFGSALAIVLAACCRLINGWAITGLVNGILWLFACLGLLTLLVLESSG